MMTIRPANERGYFDHAWLKTNHTFSFADYYDPKHMGFRALRVINEDEITGGSGFPTHGHKDMEIITFVTKGALAHKDSMGNSTAILPGEVQRMSAGTGIKHSEYNHMKDQSTHLFQIWIVPQKPGITPSYGQKSFTDQLAKGELVLCVSPDGRDGSISMNQDAYMYGAHLKSGKTIMYEVKPARHQWIQMVVGEIHVNGTMLRDSDGLAISDEKQLKITAMESSEFILFDLP